MWAIVMHVCTGLAILGTLLVGRRKWYGWLCWLVSNPLCLVDAISSGDTPKTILWGAYTVLCVMGLWEWKLRRVANDWFGW